MEIGNKLTITRGEAGEDNGGKRGRVLRNMYKGPIDMNKRMRIDCGSGGRQSGVSNGERGGTTVTQQQ